MIKQVSEITNLKVHNIQELPFYNQKLEITRDQIQVQRSLTEILFPNFKFRSFPTLLSILLIINYICQYIYFKVSKYKYFGCVLYEMGAFYTADIIHQYEFYRYFAATIYFGSIYNFVVFTLTFLMLSYTQEKQYGKLILIIYLNGGIFGLAFSSITYQNSITTGSCGIIFTILILQISNIYKQYKDQDNWKSFAGLYLILLLLNILILIETQNTNIAIVFGGILNGFGFLIYLNNNNLNEKFRKISLILVIVIYCSEVMLFGLIFNQNIDGIFVIDKFC